MPETNMAAQFGDHMKLPGKGAKLFKPVRLLLDKH